MKILTVIPCYNTSEKSYIYRCVESLKISNPKFDILIVDSGSPDKTYFERIDKKKVKILNIENKHYDIGALELATINEPNYDYYLLIHDSLIIKKDISAQIQNFPALVFRYFLCRKRVGGFRLIESRKKAINWILQRLSLSISKRNKISGYGFDNKKQIKFFELVCKNVGLTIPEFWLGTFGPVFGASKEVINQMKESKIFDYKPKNKNEQMTFERIIGLYLNSKYGSSLGVIVGNHFECDLDSYGIEKIIAFRQ